MKPITENQYSWQADLQALVVTLSLASITPLIWKWYGSRNLDEGIVIGASALFVVGRLCSQSRSILKHLLQIGIVFGTTIESMAYTEQGIVNAILLVPIGIAALEIGNRARPSWIPLVLASCVGAGFLSYGIYDAQQKVEHLETHLIKYGPQEMADIVLPTIFVTPPTLSPFDPVALKTPRNTRWVSAGATFPFGEILVQGELERLATWEMDLTFPCTGDYAGTLLKAGVKPALVQLVKVEPDLKSPARHRIARDPNIDVSYDSVEKNLHLRIWAQWNQAFPPFTLQKSL